MSLDFRFKLMRAVAVVLALYSIVWGVAPYTSINLPAKFLLDMLDWPIDNMVHTLDRNTKWLSAIGAGLLGAIAVILWGIVAPALKHGNVAVAKTTLLAFMVWYLVDSVGSLAAGVLSNIFFNTLYLIPMVIPLIGISKSTTESG